MTTAIPYENQLIGAFLYALGYADARYAAQHASGALAAAPMSPMAVNLFQQTPLDCAFSDLVIGREQCLVLEFKRSPAELGSETRKHRAACCKAFAQDKALRALSRHGHFVVYGQHAEAGVDLRLCLYLDVLGLTEPVKLDRGSARFLVDHLARPTPPAKPRLGLKPAAMVTYLDHLRRLRAEQIGSAGRIGTERWLGLARDGAGLKVVAAHSIEALLGLDIDRAPGHDLDRAIKRNRPRGPER
ncbi:hypothetical protein [Novilysobacter spongiicola]|uniref:Uncharacterized protein n=1 Tax=Lysobacter spongiicola DSM 21749 TaxID=1122188 RepID=A0A1T4M4I5_9GAMM|nr:hypothetical protein [Lysobacter spongiicola]SJZ61787.1 hypothetical protein SAMN02745674_00280 [Lysobacter spongiicola DSM 21749]